LDWIYLPEDRNQWLAPIQTLIFVQVIQNAVNFFPGFGTVSVCRKISLLLKSHHSHLAAGFMHPWFIVFPLRGASSDICTIHHITGPHVLKEYVLSK